MEIQVSWAWPSQICGDVDKQSFSWTWPSQSATQSIYNATMNLVSVKSPFSPHIFLLMANCFAVFIHYLYFFSYAFLFVLVLTLPFLVLWALERLARFLGMRWLMDSTIQVSWLSLRSLAVPWQCNKAFLWGSALSDRCLATNRDLLYKVVQD